MGSKVGSLAPRVPGSALLWTEFDFLCMYLAPETSINSVERVCVILTGVEFAVDFSWVEWYTILTSS